MSNVKGQMSNVSENTRGFTLIEFLVVATLIALFATVGVSGFQAVTRSGRDALRKSELEQIRAALEVYKAENDSYPATSSCQAPALVSDYLSFWPDDPKTPYQYCYIQGSSLTYTLCAHLENETDTDSYCGSAGNCGGSCNYQVINP